MRPERRGTRARKAPRGAARAPGSERGGDLGRRSGAERSPGERWGWLGLSFRAWLLAAVAVHLIGGLVLYEPILHPGGDNAIYMILGEALRTGEGYRDLYLPGEPLHTKYPPLYPAVLALLGFLGGAQLFKLASLAFTAGAVWLTGLVGRRLFGEGLALAGAALLALNPVLLEYSHWVLTEAAFVFFVLFSLYWLVRASPPVSPERAPLFGASRAEVRCFALGVVLAVAAFLTRTAGLALVAAGVLAAVLSGRRRRALVAAAAGAAAMVGWAAFQRFGPPGQAGYVEELLMVNPYDPAAGTVGMAGLLARTAENVWTYLASVLPETVTGAPSVQIGAAATILGLALAGLALAGWVDRALQRLDAPELFALLYAGLIAMWPAVWTDRRFLLPLVPLLLLYALRGAALLGERVGRGLAGREGCAAARSLAGARAGALILAVALILPALRSATTLAPQRMQCVAAWRAGSPCEPPAYASLYAAARWAAQNTPPDAVVANRKPSLFFWYGRRQGDVYPFSAEPEVVLHGLEEMGAGYVVVDQVSATTFRFLLPAVQAYRHRFDVVYEDGNPTTLILRFRPPPREARRP